MKAKWPEGAHGYHIDRDIILINRKKVIYIPAKLHRSIGHSVTENRNTDMINKEAFKLLVTQLQGKFFYDSEK